MQQEVNASCVDKQPVARGDFSLQSRAKVVCVTTLEECDTLAAVFVISRGEPSFIWSLEA